MLSIQTFRFAVLCALAATPVRAATQEPALLGHFADWATYVVTKNGRKVCFASAKPSSAQTNPPNRPRDPPYLYISLRPAEKVRNEVSIMIGYPFKPGSNATVEIGPTKFMMFTNGDSAWVDDPADEARMIAAMREGSELIVTGASARGAQSIDRYSLMGLSQALDRAAQECE